MTGMNISRRKTNYDWNEYIQKKDPTMTGMNISRRQTNYDWNDFKLTMSAKTAFSAFS